MSEFRVRWQDVDTFADGIKVLDGASTRAETYADHVHYETGIGDIIGYLGQVTTGHPQEVGAAFGYLQLIAELSAAELEKVATYYRDTDHEVAAKFDRSY